MATLEGRPDGEAGRSSERSPASAVLATAPPATEDNRGALEVPKAARERSLTRVRAVDAPSVFCFGVLR